MVKNINNDGHECEIMMLPESWQKFIRQNVQYIRIKLFYEKIVFD